ELRIPVEQSADQWEYGASDEHVMEMRDDEVGVVDLQVEGNRREHHAGQAAEYENEEEAHDIKHGHIEANTSAGDGGDPAEELYRGRDGDHHACCGEEALAEFGHPRCEHVMHPQAEREERGGDERRDDRRVTDDRTPRERGDDRRHDAEARKEDEIHLRVPEKPEQVLP